MASDTNRSKFFDNAKFILIFLVVFGHMISPLKEHDKILFTLYTIIYLFHMPAFIFISGYFAKGFRKKGYLLKSIQKILIPYILFQIIYSVVYYLIGKEDSIEFDFLQPHWSLWFLLSLFFWNLMLYVFARLRWKGFFVAVVLGIGIGYVDQAGGFLSLSRTFVFFPYFLLGFLFNGELLKKVIRTKYSVPVGIFILSLTLIIFGLDISKESVSWLLGDESYHTMGGEQLTDGIWRGVQYAFTIIVIFGFFSLIPSNQYKITNIGERTLYVYLLHGFIIKTIQSILPDVFLENYFFLLMVSLLVCLTLGSFMIKKFTQPLIELKL